VPTMSQVVGWIPTNSRDRDQFSYVQSGRGLYSVHKKHNARRAALPLSGRGYALFTQRRRTRSSTRLARMDVGDAYRNPFL
jgi:hypothetical protein